jgi:hypothetical protein
VPAVGGGEYAHLLLPLLEALAEKEETLVRSKVKAHRSHPCLLIEVNCEFYVGVPYNLI